jgi:hypothetical protein
VGRETNLSCPEKASLLTVRGATVDDFGEFELHLVVSMGSEDENY